MKILFTISGLLFMTLGAVGVLLPVLPTTPFLLLSAACFMRGSSRFRIWFQSTRLYQRHIQEFLESHAMTIKRKLQILIPVTILLGIILFMVHSIIARLVLIVAMILKWSYFLFRIKTVHPGDNATTDILTEP